jgi:hypothetical protein
LCRSYCYQLLKCAKYCGSQPARGILQRIEGIISLAVSLVKTQWVYSAQTESASAVQAIKTAITTSLAARNIYALLFD